MVRDLTNLVLLCQSLTRMGWLIGQGAIHPCGTLWDQSLAEANQILTQFVLALGIT